MKDWLNKLLGRPNVPKRNKVQIDMRYETHSFKMDPIFDPNLSSDNDDDNVDDINITDVKQKK